MDDKVTKLINDQINIELSSAYIYLGISNFYEELGLDGFANWYNVQVQEENDHAKLMMQYLHNNGKNVVLENIAAPSFEFKDNFDPLNVALKHEEFVTSKIHEIYALANQLHDYRTLEFLSWFVKEQGEEEKNAHDLINKAQLFGNDPKSLFLLNEELKTRAYTAPSLEL